MWDKMIPVIVFSVLIMSNNNNYYYWVTLYFKVSLLQRNYTFKY